MIDGSDALTEAVFERLTAALANVTLIGGVTSVAVRDAVKEGTPKPYVVIGETDVSDWGSKSGVGTEQTLTIEVWSEHRGRKQARQIAALVYASLHEQDFSVEGQQLVLCRFESADYGRDGDGLTYFGRLRYRILLDALSDAESE